MGRPASPVYEGNRGKGGHRRAWPTVARRCILIRAGTPVSPPSSGAKQWLGPRKEFVEEMQSKYGLKVSLHTPLASWMSVGGPMGPDIAPATYPAEARRRPPLILDPTAIKAPSLDRGRRNLAILPGGEGQRIVRLRGRKQPVPPDRASERRLARQQRELDRQAPEGWAEIDLGGEYAISQVRLSNDAGKKYGDRKPVNYRILVAAKYDADSNAAAWKAVAEISGEPLWGCASSPSPLQGPLGPRADPQERSGTNRGSTRSKFTRTSRWRGRTFPLGSPKLAAADSAGCPAGRSTICLGSKAYLDEAAKRLLGQLRRRRRLSDVRRQWVSGRLRRSHARPSRAVYQGGPHAGEPGTCPPHPRKVSQACSSKCTTC